MNSIPLLIVEDNPIYAEILRQLLQSLGNDLQFEVHWVDNAEKAQAAIQQKPYELVLLDYRLPTADGLTVLAGFASLPEDRQPAVIMLTGMGREEIAVEAMKRGAKDYLSKDNLDTTSLLRAITSALERRRLEVELRRSAAELRVRNAQLQTDLNLAREIQEAFLPHTYPVFPLGIPAAQTALRFCHRYLPTTVLGGDFFDVFPVGEHKVGLLISDVMGHGVRAALITAILRALAEELAPVAADPGRFLTEVNRRMLGILRQSRTPMFATACYFVVDIRTGESQFSIAGHPSPIQMQRSVRKVVPLTPPPGQAGPALGAFEDATFPVCPATLVAGDTIILYTDGLVDVGGKDSQFLGEKWLLNTLRKDAAMPTDQIFDAVLADAHAFATAPEFSDDVCLLGMDVIRVGQ